MVNRDHSQILFEIPYLKAMQVQGRFTHFRGHAVFDGDALIEAKVEVDADSVHTGNSIRDGHLKGADFFDAKRFPLIRFITKGSESGKLTIQETSREIHYDLEFSESLDTWDKRNRFVSFSFTIQRGDFGLTWNRALEAGGLLVGDQVRVRGTFQLQPKGAATPTSSYMIPSEAANRDQTTNPAKSGTLASDQTVTDDFADDSAETSPKTSAGSEVQKSVTTKPETLQRDPVKAKRVATTKGTGWWIGMLVLGLLGFLSSLILSIHSKKIISDFLGEKYSEEGFWGNFADSIAIIWVMAYALAFWAVF